ncbi:MAG: hypothetical protein U0807_03470 [Candidatus Binatia bacterium]
MIATADLHRLPEAALDVVQAGSRVRLGFAAIAHRLRELRGAALDLHCLGIARGLAEVDDALGGLDALVRDLLDLLECYEARPAAPAEGRA